MTIPCKINPLGVDAVQLPAGYTRLQYLESSGGQYIETDIIPDVSDELTLDCQNFENSTGNANYIVVGSALASDRPEIGFAWGTYGSSASDFAYVWLGSTNGAIGGSEIWPSRRKTERFLINLKNGEIQINKEKIQLRFVQKSTVAAAWSYRFFIRWHTADVSGRLFKFERKNVDLGEKNVLVPCLDETGAPCLFDSVNRISYYNSGSGDFAYA